MYGIYIITPWSNLILLSFVAYLNNNRNNPCSIQDCTGHRLKTITLCITSATAVTSCGVGGTGPATKLILGEISMSPCLLALTSNSSYFSNIDKGTFGSENKSYLKDNKGMHE